jgi:hypothetical protein
MSFFPDSLLSAGCIGDAPIVFFRDKDFDYINVIEEMFCCLASSILGATSRIRIRKITMGRWFLLKQVTLTLTNSPTCEAYTERENKDMPKDVTPYAFHWVLAYRQNLPTKGCNDTQAVKVHLRC